MIRSAAEQNVYSAAMKNMNLATAWIGVTRSEAGSCRFRTVLNEELYSVGYAGWTNVYGKQEPHNENNGQNCVNIVSPGGGMDDDNCEKKMAYLCKIDY